MSFEIRWGPPPVLTGFSEFMLGRMQAEREAEKWEYEHRTPWGRIGGMGAGAAIGAGLGIALAPVTGGLSLAAAGGLAAGAGGAVAVGGGALGGALLGGGLGTLVGGEMGGALFDEQPTAETIQGLRGVASSTMQLGAQMYGQERGHQLMMERATVPHYGATLSELRAAKPAGMEMPEYMGKLEAERRKPAVQQLNQQYWSRRSGIPQEVAEGIANDKNARGDPVTAADIGYGGAAAIAEGPQSWKPYMIHRNAIQQRGVDQYHGETDRRGTQDAMTEMTRTALDNMTIPERTRWRALDVAERAQSGQRGSPRVLQGTQYGEALGDVRAQKRKLVQDVIQRMPKPKSPQQRYDEETVRSKVNPNAEIAWNAKSQEWYEVTESKPDGDGAGMQVTIPNMIAIQNDAGVEAFREVEGYRKAAMALAGERRTPEEILQILGPPPEYDAVRERVFNERMRDLKATYESVGPEPELRGLPSTGFPGFPPAAGRAPTPAGPLPGVPPSMADDPEKAALYQRVMAGRGAPGAGPSPTGPPTPSTQPGAAPGEPAAVPPMFTEQQHGDLREARLTLRRLMKKYPNVHIDDWADPQDVAAWHSAMQTYRQLRPMQPQLEREFGMMDRWFPKGEVKTPEGWHMTPEEFLHQPGGTLRAQRLINIAKKSGGKISRSELREIEKAKDRMSFVQALAERLGGP